MDQKVIIQLTNPKALGILHELEALHLIKVLQETSDPTEQKLSEKFKSVFSKEDAKNFEEHTNTMRKEWDNI